MADDARDTSSVHATARVRPSRKVVTPVNPQRFPIPTPKVPVGRRVHRQRQHAFAHALRRAYALRAPSMAPPPVDQAASTR
jgi:hypothetical protein